MTYTDDAPNMATFVTHEDVQRRESMLIEACLPLFELALQEDEVLLLRACAPSHAIHSVSHHQALLVVVALCTIIKRELFAIAGFLITLRSEGS